MFFSSAKEQYPLVEVPSERIEYNQGDLVAPGLRDCSAVIFDYRNEALMAHAVSDSIQKSIDPHGWIVSVDNVVLRLMVEAFVKNFAFDEIQVYVNASSTKQLNHLLADLDEKGLPVVKADTFFCPVDVGIG